MPKKIDLNKTSSIDLSKTGNLDLAKAGGSNLNIKVKGAGTNNFTTIGITDPVPGLQPIGNTGFWVTPSEPTDVSNCSLYPDSFYCGGIPLSLTPVGADVEVAIDACYVGMSITPIVGFFKLPPVQIVYQHSTEPECYPPKPYEYEPEKDAPKKPPTLPKNPCSKAGNCVLLFVAEEKGHWVHLANPGNPLQGEVYIERHVELLDFQFPYIDFVALEEAETRGYLDPYFYVQARATVRISGFYKESGFYHDTDYGLNGPGYPPFGGSDAFGQEFYGYSHDKQEELFCNSRYLQKSRDNTGGGTPHALMLLNDYDTALEAVDFAAVNSDYLNYKYWNNDNSTLDEPYNKSQSIKKIGYQILCATPATPPLLPPHTLPKPPPDEMDCCPQILSLLAQLKQKLIQTELKVNKLAEVVGIEEYPASLPASLISKDQGWLGNMIPDAPATLPNLTQLVVQQIKYIDELFGQWEIPIEVKDSDPLTPGDQPIGIKLPNLAEYAAESFLLQFRGSIDQATMLNMMTRILIEVGQIKQQDFRAYGLLQTLVDYLGFDYSESQKDLPLSFNPQEDSFEKLLKEIVIKVPYAEYTEKRDFRADLFRLLEAAAITKAVNTRKVPGGNSPGAMKSHIMQTIKDKAAQIKKEEDKQKTDMDKFIDNTEKGFPILPGVEDPNKPYGRPYEQRPEIKKIKEE